MKNYTKCILCNKLIPGHGRTSCKTVCLNCIFEMETNPKLKFKYIILSQNQITRFSTITVEGAEYYGETTMPFDDSNFMQFHHRDMHPRLRYEE